MTAPKDPYYAAGREPAFIDVPELPFIAVDGQGGDPNTSPEFQDAVGALYGLAYTIKMSPKKGEEPTGYEPFRVGALEGLWWIGGKEPVDVTSPDAIGSKEDWSWTLLIRMPAFVTSEIVEGFRSRLRQKHPENTRVNDLRFARLTEGYCVQCLHVGPYATEPETMQKMKAFAESHGKKLRGKHHEIYLGDPRRSKPENLKTVLRHPVN